MKNNIFSKPIMANITGTFARWNRPVAVDPAQVNNLSEILSVSRETSSLLLRRTAGRISPAVDLWAGEYPFPGAISLPGIEESVHRLGQAVGSQEHVLVYSDFDADGITSAVILKEVLEFAGIRNVTVFFPCRFQDGYGFHPGLIDGFHVQGVNLIITADCGITGWDACDKAKSLGIDVIITDHHRIGPYLPEALSVINPQLPSWKPFELQGLSGAGVAYLLARAFLEEKGLMDEIPRDWAIDMLALSIAGDGQPVTGLNRVWVKEGLNVLQQARRPGILALLCVSGIFRIKEGYRQHGGTVSDRASTQGSIDFDAGDEQAFNDRVEVRDLEFERDVMFGLVPRINAAGRLSHAGRAFELLCESNLHRAFEIAAGLDKLNRQRRSIEQAMLEECYETIDSLAPVRTAGDELSPCEEAAVNYAGHSRYSVCAFGASWHEGVLGIAASRMRDRYWRPCAMVAGQGPVLKGSVRGIPGLNVHEALSECRELLVNFGGHKAAGGFSVRSENMSMFADRFESVVKRLLGENFIEPVLQLDELLDVEDCREETLMPYVSLEPFGRGNPRPVIGVFECKIRGARLLGKARNHLELTIGGKHNPVRLIWFGAGDTTVQACLPGVCDLTFTPNKNTYLGRERISLFIEDVRLPWSLLGHNYRELAQHVSGRGPTIIYTWSSDAASSICIGLLHQGVEAGLHLRGQDGALAHNAKLILRRGKGAVVSTSPWDLVGEGLEHDTRLLVVHPPISGASWSKLSAFSMSQGVKCIFLDGYLEDSNTWLVARFPSKEYIEQVWKSLVERPGNGKIPVWEAGPLYSRGFAEREGAVYEHELVLLESCISIMMELGMISYDVISRVPWFVLHRPRGQVSLSGSALYVQGRLARRAAGRLLERFEGGIRHGGKR